MNKMVYRNLAVLLVAVFLVATPKTVFADGRAGDGYIATVNGYTVELDFKSPVMAGENIFHIRITDSMGIPVPNAEVEVSAMLSEGMTEHGGAEEMVTEDPSIDVMTSNDTMEGMDMSSEDPSSGVMQPNEPSPDEHGEEAQTIVLEPTEEIGEYAGETHFETSGEWMFNVHFTVEGETTEVDFPIDVTRTLSLKYAVLAGFLGINGTVIASAVLLKRKSAIARDHH